jgi:hypothetical protein
MRTIALLGGVMLGRGVHREPIRRSDHPGIVEPRELGGRVWSCDSMNRS